MNCPTEGCGKPLVQTDPEMSTLVGYSSPEGHNHGDNCRKRGYRCSDGHGVVLSERNRCSAPHCTWVGKAECFCHPGKKVDKFPDVPIEWAPQWIALERRGR